MVVHNSLNLIKVPAVRLKMLADNFEGWLVATETTHQQWQTGIEQRLGLRWAVCGGEGAGKGGGVEGGEDGGRRRWREGEMEGGGG